MLYEADTLRLASDDDVPSFDSSVFDAVADLIFNAGGFDIDQIKDPAARKLIAETVAAINMGVDAHLPTDVPDTLRYALEENTFIFSGFKTFHAMREIGLSLVNDKGEIKSYSDFQADVLKINQRYNTNYLYAEYKHAVGTAQMAARWVGIEADGDRYLLQYRTAQDDRVREDHALMDGITLPPSDPFWDKYYPPNGWGCRCTAVQVRRGKYAESDPVAAMRLGDNSTEAAKQQIFRFNAGKTLQLFPPKHPYYKAPEAAKRAIEQLADNYKNHRAEYESLLDNPDYIGVKFDPASGGVTAVHVGHNFDKVGGAFEKHAQNAALKAGYSVILENEPQNVYGKRSTEGTWDGLQFEVAGATNGKINNIRNALKHCAHKRTTEIAVIDFPNGSFSLDNFNEALKLFNGLEKLHDGQFLKFKKIICIQDEQIIHVVEI